MKTKIHSWRVPVYTILFHIIIFHTTKRIFIHYLKILLKHLHKNKHQSLIIHIVRSARVNMMSITENEKHNLHPVCMRTEKHWKLSAKQREKNNFLVYKTWWATESNYLWPSFPFMKAQGGSTAINNKKLQRYPKIKAVERIQKPGTVCYHDVLPSTAFNFRSHRWTVNGKYPLEAKYCLQI